MAIDDFKFYGNVFRQTIDDVKAYLAKKGKQFNPNTNYPAYTGSISVPVEAVADLIDYLTQAAPVYDKQGRASIKLSVKGWVKQPEGGKAYQSFNIEPDYRTAQAILQGSAPQAQQQPPRQTAPAAAPALDFDDDIPF